MLTDFFVLSKVTVLFSFCHFLANRNSVIFKTQDMADERRMWLKLSAL